MDLHKMNVAELKVKAKDLGLKDYSKLKKSDLISAIVLKEFILDRNNQAMAIGKAKQLKDISNGTWFTLKGIELDSRPKYKSRGKMVYGEPIVKQSELELTVNTLSLFGLIKRRLRANKDTIYKIKLEVAHKAIEEHNRRLEVSRLILNK